MSRKFLTIIFLLFLIILAAILGYYYFVLKKQPALPNPPGSETEGLLFPFSDNGPTGTVRDTQKPEAANTNSSAMPILRQITNVPVAGATIFESKDGTMIRYVERATGHVYEAKANAGTPRRLTNTTIPKIYEAIWVDSQSVILRYLKDGSENIETFFAKITTPKGTAGQTGTSTSAISQTSVASLEGVFLQKGISELAVSPNKEKIFYIVPTGNGVSGVTANPDGTKKAEVWNSPLRGWQVSWPSGDTIALTVKPTATAPGFLYLLGSRSGSISKIKGGVNGLTALPSGSAKQVLYSLSTGAAVDTFLLDVRTNTSDSFPLKTLPEKCVWGRKDVNIIYCAVPKNISVAELPDSWYQGVASFIDDLWSANLLTGTTKIIASPEDLVGSQTIDATNLSLNETDEYLIFINKKDLTPWVLRVK